MYNISKTLSANDTAETGSHQAGILIPKDPKILSFFPALDSFTKNPRVHIDFVDENERRREFAFIYYNNRLFGGTRNEYRLTRMTKYIRECGLTAGDDVVFSREDGQYFVRYSKKNVERADNRNVLVLKAGWKVIKI